MKTKVILISTLVVFSSFSVAYALNSTLLSRSDKQREVELEQCYKNDPENILVTIDSNFFTKKDSKDSKEKKVLNFFKKNIDIKSVSLAFDDEYSESLKNTFAVNTGEYVTKKLEKIVEKIQKIKSVKMAGVNRCFLPEAIPNDPLYKNQYHHEKINSVQAWDINTGSDSVVIAILDPYGVQEGHEDLIDNVWINEGEIPSDGIDNDGNGYVDDIHGWDFMFNDNGDYGMLQTKYHGTQVAGLAAAKGNNAIGVTGVCQSCKIMALTVKNTRQMIPSFKYAVDNGAKIIEMSFGAYGADPYTNLAVNDAYNSGLLMIASAGNDNTDDLHYPSDCNHVMSIAFTDTDDQSDEYTNYGTGVDMSAPGQYLLSTFIDGVKGVKYVPISGTSAAAPLVAGAAGLLWSEYPGLSSDEVYNILKYSAKKIDTIKPIGTGMLDAYAALNSNGKVPAPFAIIESPWNGNTIPFGENVDLIGSAVGSSYKIEYQREDETQWHSLANMQGQVMEGQLTILSAYLLNQGYNYILRLTVSADNNGQIITDSHEVKILVQ